MEGGIDKPLVEIRNTGSGQTVYYADGKAVDIDGGKSGDITKLEGTEKVYFLENGEGKKAFKTFNSGTILFFTLFITLPTLIFKRIKQRKQQNKTTHD